jgi:hypothetical protein
LADPRYRVPDLGFRVPAQPHTRCHDAFLPAPPGRACHKRGHERGHELESRLFPCGTVVVAPFLAEQAASGSLATALEGFERDGLARDRFLGIAQAAISAAGPALSRCRWRATEFWTSA